MYVYILARASDPRGAGALHDRGKNTELARRAGTV